jgi:cysteine-rich repeat protein
MKKFIFSSTLLALSCSGAQPVVPPRCGDGASDTGELCDDGNNVDGDGCDSFCRLEQAGQGEVFFNEIVASAVDAGPDAIELVNPSDLVTSLAGFQIQDAGGNVFTFVQDTVIQPGEHLVLFRDEQNSFTFGIGSDDALTLLDPQGNAIDSADWIEGEIPEGTSFGRFPDATGSFQRLNTVTLGAANVANEPSDCGDGIIDAGEVCDGDNLNGQTCADLGFTTGAPQCALDCLSLLVGTCQDGEVLEVVINEIVAKATNSGPDAIEILNIGDAAVDLSGVSLRDSNVANTPFVFAAGTTLAPGAFLSLAEGADFSFGLGAADSLSLQGAQGVVLDSVAWVDGDSPEGKSYGRFPNGTGNFKTLDVVTIGSANVDNVAAGCGDGVIDAGELCDGAALGGETCESFGLTSGVIACLADCSDVDVAQCLGSADGSIFVNEVVAKAVNSGPDAIELFNADIFSVDLTGLQMVDQGGGQFIFGAGVILAPGDFLVLEKDAAGSFTFGLGDDDLVSLRDSAGVEIDLVDWTAGQAPEGASFGRFPDGQGAPRTLNTVTLGQTNVE